MSAIGWGFAAGTVYALGLLGLYVLGQVTERGDQRLADLDFDDHTDDAVRLFDYPTLAEIERARDWYSDGAR